MSYRIEQKNGKHIYIYEVEAYWDSEKKQARQHRKYIGKKDLKTGEIVTPIKSNRPKLTKDYGAVCLLKDISKKIGLLKLLKKYFPNEYEKILSLAFFLIIEKQALYLYKDWFESSDLDTNNNMSPKEISNFLKSLHLDELARTKFITSWFKTFSKSDSILFDITSVSSFGEQNESVEWGYNRDQDILPQINLGMVYSDESKLPLFYKTYQGSIRDVSTIKNIIDELSSKQISNMLFVLDRGFYSKENIDKIINSKFSVLIPGVNNTKIIRELMLKYQDTIKQASYSFLIGKQVMHHISEITKIGKHKLKTHIYYSDKRRSEEYDFFMRILLESENILKSKKFKSKEEFEEYLITSVSKHKKYFKFDENSLEVKRDEESLKKRLSSMGIMILFTNTNKDKIEILDLYRRRDSVEKLFDTFKNELNGDRIRVHTKDSMDGLFFVKFISLIIHSSLSNTMKTQELNKKYTVRELLQELKKLKKVKMLNDKIYVTEVSKKQKEILKTFEINIPI
jgi:transposase